MTDDTTAWRLSRPIIPLWRTPGVLQLDADASVLLTQVPDGTIDALTLLATPQTRAGLQQLLPNLGSRFIDWLIAELSRTGILDVVRQAAAFNVAVIGSGLLADDITIALSNVGITPNPRVFTETDKALEPAEMAHWSRFVRDWPDLTVLALPTAEPDRVLLTELQQAGKTQLVVRIEANRAVVGPLVIPNRSPCIRCLDLARCRADPSWPAMLAQLCRVTPTPLPQLLAWAVSTATLQVQAYVIGSNPDALGRTIEISATEPVLKSVTVQAHPDCGCGA